MRGATVLLAAGLAVGAVGTAVAQRVEQASDWRLAATEDDRVRLRGWRTAWVKGLAQARAGGSAAALAELGPLANPDHSIADPKLPDGDYRCRTIKMGSQGRAVLTYVAYPFFRCRVSENGVRLTKLDGSQRLTGRLYPDTDARSIFLGTLMLGDEERSYAYGRDRARDMAGVLERIDTDRWRIAFPYPAYESVVDILELVPAAGA
ncbi:DUF4893 domain-containing protein [Sphingomonas sp. Marseille-Q8236]